MYSEEPNAYSISYYKKNGSRFSGQMVCIPFVDLKCRDIYFAKYFGKGEGGKWPSGKKNKKLAVRVKK